MRWFEVERPKTTGSSGGSSEGATWQELNLAELEAEVFLLGHWKNFADLEEKLSLPELQAILEAAREKEHRRNKFAAALKGVNLDGDAKEENQRRLDEIQKRVDEKLYGAERVQKRELLDLGIEIETEE